MEFGEKPLVSRRPISHRLLCTPLFILTFTLTRGEGVSLNKTDNWCHFRNVKDFTEGSPMTHAHLLISSKSSPCRVKLWIYIKTIPLICNALPMISFCMIQVSAVFSNKLYIVKSRDFEFHIPSIPSRHHIWYLVLLFLLLIKLSK